MERYHVQGSYEERSDARPQQRRPQPQQRDGPLSQLWASICASFLGVFLFFGALLLAARSERGAVCASRALEEARAQAVTVGCRGGGAQEAAWDGRKPAYFSCEIDEASLPRWTPGSFGTRWLDGAFEVGAVKVRQRVEMLQCQEQKTSREVKDGDTVTTVDRYTYRTVWAESRIPSEHFRGWSNTEAKRALEEGCGASFAGNPLPPMESRSLSAPSLVVGGYDLSRHMPSIAAAAPVALRQGRYWAPQPAAHAGAQRRTARDGQSYTLQEFLEFYGEEKGRDMWDEAGGRESSRGGQMATEEAQVSENVVQTCGRPEVGCLRISYFQSTARHASHLAALAGESRSTRAWSAPSSWMCSAESFANQVDLFSPGDVPLQRLIADAQATNHSLLWLLRALFFFMASAGVYLFLQPIQTLVNLVDQFFDWFKGVPVLGWALDFFGDMLAGAVGQVIAFISAGVALPSSLAVIALTWCFMRPTVALPLLAGSALLLGYTVVAMRSLRDAGRLKRKKA